jgi:hypothetical protein
MTPARLALFRVALPALCLACSESGGDPASDAPGAGASALDPSAPTVGSFVVNLVAPTSTTDGFTSVLGRVYDGPQPPPLGWEVAATAQGCELRIPVAPFCDPGCDTTAVCTPADGCVPYPVAQDLGTVTMTGLAADAIEMKPIAATYQLPPAIELPHPPTAEGAAIGLQTSGGNYQPFTLAGAGIAPLELLGSEPIPLVETEALTLQWGPPSDPAASRIAVKVDISHHGGLKGLIECDVEDDGELEIEASLLEQLIALGTAGFPTINVTRAATGGARIEPGNVLLSVSSRVERALEIEGIVSCNDDDECAAGQTCLPNRTCQGSGARARNVLW